MKIAITATGPEFNSVIDPRFGRCQYFLILDEEGKLLKAIPNEGIEAMRGAGITAAQIVADEKVDVIITGNVGPRAYMVLEQSGIKIFIGAPNITVKQVFEMYKRNELEEIDTSRGFGFGPGFGGGQEGRRMGR